MELYTPNCQDAYSTVINTTFESASAGTGTWAISEWGDADAGSGNNDPDIASSIKWINDGFQSQVVTGAYSGSQCGRIIGSSSTSEKFCKLDIGSGENTGTYTMTWYQKTEIQTGTSDRRYSYVLITDDNYDIAARIQLNPGKGDIEIYDGTNYTKIMDAVDNTWYEFEMTLNYQTQKFDVKARQAGSTGAWNVVTNQDFYSSASDSFDRVYCRARCNEIYGYWDDIITQENP